MAADDSQERDQLIAELAKLKVKVGELKRTETEMRAEIQVAHWRIAELEQSEEELEQSEEILSQVRQALRTSEEQYRMAFEHTGTAMMIVEEDTTISKSNHKATEITGYSPEELENKRRWTEFVVKEEIEEMMRYHRERRTDPSRTAMEYEIHTIHKSGELRDLLVNVTIIPGTRKSLVSLIDITKRKQAERELRMSERRFRETADLLPGIICEIDTTGKLIYTNKQALDTFGYSHEEYLQGVDAIELIDHEDTQRAVEGMKKIMAGETTMARPYRMRCKDGSLLDVIITSAPMVVDGKICGQRSCILDVTELRRAEKQLLESEERFRSIFLQSSVGAAIVDDKGLVRDSNGAFNQMFMVDGNVAEEGLNVFGFIDLDESERAVLEPGTSITRQGWWPKNTYDEASDGARHTSRRRYLDWNITSLWRANHKERSFLVQVNDITERRLAEEASLRAAHQETERARSLIQDLRKQIEEGATFQNMVSRSPQMKRLFDILPQVAETTATVLIVGESGTGKELIARSLHELSPRKDRPFIAINCGALPDTLLESELFGYKPGAFTDAKKAKLGKFALAEGGTIFLDEIGDISPAMQLKLLRVLQERMYEPLGATNSVRADVRVIAATNQDLKDAVEKGRFRQDLYYRINVMTMELPPLRERRADIPLLCDHFIRKYNARYDRDIREVSQEALSHLMAHEYPGNIRELENIIERAFIFCKGPSIELSHMPVELRNGTAIGPEAQVLARIKSFDDLERLYIQAVLAETGGNKLRAARRLGIHKTTFFRKLKKLGIDTKADDR